jgi:hypothetical protein
VLFSKKSCLERPGNSWIGRLWNPGAGVKGSDVAFLIWQKGEHDMLGAAIVIPGIVVLVLVILLVVYLLRRA